MDRRQFVPSADALEGRALLSSLGSTSSYSRGHRPHEIPITFQQKTTRIDRFPLFLARVEPGRVVPKAVVEQAQADLTAIRGKWHGPKPAALNEFNLQLREAERHASLSPATARALDATFDRALESAGATPDQVAHLQADLDNLVRNDVHDRQPVLTATNDAAILLQTALGVGRVIHTPKAPTLAAGDRAGGDPHLVRGVLRPRFVGTYDPNTQINLLDGAGNVIGTTTTGTSGHYVVSPANLLTNGTFEFRVQAVDAGGDTSDPSAPLIVTIAPNGSGPVPRGPLIVSGGLQAPTR